MPHRSIQAILLLIFVAGCARPPAVPKRLETSGELEALFRSAANYKFGESREALSELESRVISALNDTTGPEITRRLAGDSRTAALRSGLSWLAASLDSTFDAKLFACRQLAIVGTSREVAALESLLDEEKMADVARIALEKIPGNSATRALARGLDGAEGNRRIGIINSLGERRDPAAIAPILRAMGPADEELFEAGTAALAKIGGRRAVTNLAGLRAAQSGARRQLATDALLICADALMREGNARTAAAIYEECLGPEEPIAIRSAALRGLAAARPERAPALLIRSLHDDEPKLRAQAARLVRSVPGARATAVFADELPKLDPASRLQVISALGDRKDLTAAPAISAFLDDEDPSMRIAALRALAQFGDPATVAVLAKHGASEEPSESRTAQMALGMMESEKPGAIESEMVRILESGADAKTQIVIARALADRQADFTVPALIKGIQSEAPSVRAACYVALAELAGERQLDEIAKAAAAESDAEVRAKVAEALAAIAKRSKEPEAQVSRVLMAMDQTKDPASRAALLLVAGEIGGVDALDALLGALKDRNREIRLAAVESLSAWPNGGPAERLRVVAEMDSDREIRRRAWAGYARLLPLSGKHTPEQLIALYKEALWKTGAEEKEGVVAGLAGAKSLEGLKLAESYLSGPYREAASSAAIAIAREISGSYPEQAKAVMKQIADSGGEEAKRNAGAVLRAIEKFEDYLTAWEVAGPYTAPNKNGSELLDIPFEPETGEAKWQPIPAGTEQGRPWMLDLQKALHGENRAAYLRTRVWSPEDQQARLEIGSDDGVKVWLNGEAVHANNASRSVSPGDDVVRVKLRKGWNPLTLKVTNGGGDWGVCARLRSAKGEKLEGLRAEIGGGQATAGN